MDPGLGEVWSGIRASFRVTLSNEALRNTASVTGICGQVGIRVLACLCYTGSYELVFRHDVQVESGLTSPQVGPPPPEHVRNLYGDNEGK